MFEDSVIAECLADASQTAQYVWKNETVGVVSNDRYLRLNNFDDIDGGNYTCTAANILGSEFTNMLYKHNLEKYTHLLLLTKKRLFFHLLIPQRRGTTVSLETSPVTTNLSLSLI